MYESCVFSCHLQDYNCKGNTELRIKQMICRDISYFCLHSITTGEPLNTGNIFCTVLWVLNTLRPRQNSLCFADGTFKHIFLNENVRISIKISLKFVPKGTINNNPALVQIMAWRRPGNKPLSEPTMVDLLTSPGFNELSSGLFFLFFQNEDCLSRYRD